MHATGWYQSSLYRVDKLVPLHRTCSWVTRFHLATIFVIQHPQTGKLHELPSAVSKQQPLEIYDPVKVEPTQLVLLWDPVSEFKYTHTLKVCAYVCMFLCRDYWLLHWQDVDKIHSNWYTFTEVCKYWKLCESHGSHTFTLFTLPYPKYYIAEFPWSARGSTNCKMHNSSMKCICAKFSDAQCVVDCTIMMKICYLGLSRLSIIQANKVCTILLITATMYTTSEPHFPEMLSRHILTCACSPLLGYRWEWQLPMVMWPWRCGGYIQQWHLDDRYQRKDPSCCSWYEEHSSLWPGWGTWEFKLCLAYRS